MALLTPLCRRFSCLTCHETLKFAASFVLVRKRGTFLTTQLCFNNFPLGQFSLNNFVIGNKSLRYLIDYSSRCSSLLALSFRMGCLQETFHHQRPSVHCLGYSSRYRIDMICPQKFQDTEQMSSTFATNRVNRSCAGFRKTKQKLQDTKKKVARSMGAFKENVFTVPNGLCMLRIAATPILGYLIINNNFVPALVLFGFAGITDMLDGFIARTFPSQQSMIGSFLDPFADKLLVVTLFAALTVSGLIPVPLTALIMARDASLVAAATFIRYQSIPSPKTASKFFDVTFATAKLSPTLVSKVNTFVQLAVVAAALGAPIFHYVDHPNVISLWYLAAGTTILSWMSYIFSRNTYQILGAQHKQKKWR